MAILYVSVVHVCAQYVYRLIWKKKYFAKNYSRFLVFASFIGTIRTKYNQLLYYYITHFFVLHFHLRNIVFYALISHL